VLDEELHAVGGAEADRDQRVLVDEAVDVTLPWDRPGRRPASGLTVGERLADVFVNMGWSPKVPR
jgi:phenylalanyl-tRNA synthetase alpha chain